MSVKRGIFLAPFDELADPRLLGELARSAEAGGWDGFFLWDHIVYRAPVRAVADPWVALAAIACATDTLRVGPLVTPLSRRRMHKLARETVTLDHLSRGRLTLGVGLGSDRNGELEPFGEVVDARERARLLDQGLERLEAFWGGELSRSRCSARGFPSGWPPAGRNRRPVRRGARWDGLFPIDLPGPDELAVLAAEIRELRAGSRGAFDLVAETPPGGDVHSWELAGATWVLTGFGMEPREAEVRAAIEAGPGY